MISKANKISIARRSKTMTSVAQIGRCLKYILEERANVLARQTGCIKRHRKFSGADLAQMLVFGWLAQPDASLEMLASLAATREIQVSDTAVHKRFNRACAHFLHALLEEMMSVLVEASQDAPLELLKRFESVVLEDSSSIALPDTLAELWQGCGGAPGGEAALKIHVRWDLTHGSLQGPGLTSGRTSDHLSPFNEDPLPEGSLYIADLGYASWAKVAARRAARSYTLTRAPARTMFWTPGGKRFKLEDRLPQRVGETNECWVRVGDQYRYLMRLLMLRVPDDVAERRREALRADAVRRHREVSAKALELAAWTLLLTDVPPSQLTLPEALVLLRERWQIELLFKLWKQYGHLDEWRTSSSWRILCEIYAKLIGLLLQHWLFLLFAWHNPQRSLVKLSQIVRQTAHVLLEALAGHCSLRWAFRVIERRMRSGTQMNTRKKHPNSAQLLNDGLNWAIDP
jgi:hypothetical protein